MAVLTPRSVFRRYNVDGVPSSGSHKPQKSEIIQLLNLFFGTSRGGWVVAGTKAELDGVTPENETDGGVVLDDPTASNNGYYQRDASAWVRERGFPDTFARVALSGSGSTQTGVVEAGVNPADVEVFFAFVDVENTGSMTLAIGGEEPREVLNLAGQPLSAGEWTGVVMFVLNDDGDYRLIIDAGAAASAAQSASDAAGYAGEAEADADRAEAAAQSVVARAWFKTVANLLADNNGVIGYAGSGADFIVAPGDIITAQGFRYEVVASNAVDAHVETAGGVKLKVVGEAVRPGMLGVVGDGVADDTDLFRKALEIANERNGSLIGDPGARYRITENIEINRAGKTGLLVDLQGAELLLDEGSIWFGGDEPFLETTLAADAAIGDSYLTLSDVTGLAPGDLLDIESPAVSMGAVNTAHTYLVNYIDGNDVWIVGSLVADITDQQVIDSGKTGDIAVSAYKLAPGLVIRNADVEHVDTLGMNIGILVKQQFAPRLKNIVCDGHTRNQIYVQYGSHDVVENCVFTGMGYTDEKEPTYSARPEAPDGQAWGYGLIHARNYFSEVKNCSGFQGWHVFDAARGQMHINYENCSGFRCAYAFSTHESSWHVNYINCENHGDLGWQIPRSVHVYMEGCKQISERIDGAGNGVAISRALQSVKIINCNIEKFTAAGTASTIYTDTTLTAGPGVKSVGKPPVWEASGNTFSGFARLSFGTPGGDTIMRNNTYSGQVAPDIFGADIYLKNEMYDDGPQHGAAITTDNSFVADGCISRGSPSNPSSSALFFIVGTPAYVSLRDSNAPNYAFLLRVLNSTNAITIRDIVNCDFKQAVLAGSNVTIENIFNTTREINDIVAGGCTVTKSQNNWLL